MPNLPALWQRLRRSHKQWRTLRELRRRDAKFARKAAAFAARHPELPVAGTLAPQRAVPAFSHAGNAGDIIYSLPSLIALSSGRKARLLLKTGVKTFYAEGVHPLGQLQLDERTAAMLRPLLEIQPYIESAPTLREGDHVDCVLDVFRDAPLPGDKGSIARWYFYCFGVSADLSRPWLHVEADPRWRDYVLVARSQRYRNPALDHGFLSRYPKLAFIGVDAEYEDMRRMLPAIERVPVPDFLAMAQAIAGAQLFIGNASLPYAIAEALKVRRVLETCHRVPNVVPDGPDACEAWFQPQFEATVARLHALPRA